MKIAAKRAHLDTFFSRYLAAGFSTVPVRSRSKQPLTRWKTAQTNIANAAIVAKWLDRYACEMGIGIITGSISRLVVIDVDTDEADAEVLAMIERYPTTTVRSGKGWHYYYRSAENEVVPLKVRFAEGIDCKAEGGYVVAPPSIHPNGKAYEFLTPLADMADLPQELRERILRGSNEIETYTDFGTTKWKINVLGAEEGGRNDSAASITGKLVEHMPRELWEFAWSAIQDWNQLNKPPLTVKELRTTFNSICAIEMRKRAAKRAEAESAGAAGEYQPIRLSSTATRAYDTPGYAVSDMIIEGCTVLAGKPKRGKSIFSLQLGLAVAAGKPLFHANSLAHIAGGRRYSITQGDVLYLALEDNERRFVSRARDLYGAKALPAAFHVTCNWPTLAAGGVLALHSWVDANPDAKLIVVDSLTAFLGNPTAQASSNGAFRGDYEVIRSFFDFSQERRIAVLIIHHARKTQGRASDVDDPMDAVSGTLGGIAAADTFMLFDRALDSEYVMLHIAGRDVPSHKIALKQPRPKDIAHDPLTRFDLGDMEALISERRGKSMK